MFILFLIETSKGKIKSLHKFEDRSMSAMWGPKLLIPVKTSLVG